MNDVFPWNGTQLAHRLLPWNTRWSVSHHGVLQSFFSDLLACSTHHFTRWLVRTDTLMIALIRFDSRIAKLQRLLVHSHLELL